MYFLLTLPMRRNERARLVLDLVELGLKEGRNAEATLVAAAASRDPSLGVRFQLAAEYLQKGLRLSQALENVPRLLPPQVAGMLRTGEKIGDLRKVLPACRQFLKDGVSQVRGALNYLIILVFAVTPAILFVPLVFRIKVLPKLVEVFSGMLEGRPLPAFTRAVFGLNPLSCAIQIGLLAFLWLALVCYVGGPRLRESLRHVFPEPIDWFLCRLPWRRKRLQRDFSAMLAVLLDAGVPEGEAIGLAADSTANEVIVARGTKVRKLLTDGVKLPEALRVMDDTRELQWRLANALARGRDFLKALSGWHEALDAKAFQLEQSAAQVATTLVVLVNGFLVASIVIAVFLVLVQLLNAAVLW
jgi:type II secretory pathway component PulF